MQICGKERYVLDALFIPFLVDAKQKYDTLTALYSSNNFSDVCASFTATRDLLTDAILKLTDSLTSFAGKDNEDDVAKECLLPLASKFRQSADKMSDAVVGVMKTELLMHMTKCKESTDSLGFNSKVVKIFKDKVPFFVQTRLLTV